MEGDESTSNFSSEEEFATSQDEGLNEPQQDGRRERPQKRRKEWPHDWWVATKEVERATIAFSEELQTVARGFTQTFGVDYNETFAPVAKFVSIRCILTLVAIENMEIHQMDVKTTFLNGDFKKEIYMEQPEGFTQEGSSCVQASQVIVRVETISKGLEPKIKCFLEKHQVCEE